MQYNVTVTIRAFEVAKDPLFNKYSVHTIIA